MSTYVLPQVLVFQDRQVAPQAQANPLPAHITGPHAQLVRFAHADEQPHGYLAHYDPVTSNAYDWPGRKAGAVVDQTYTKLWAKNALLQYFTDASTVTKTAGFKNRVTSSSINFVTAGAAAHNAILLDRDVQLGDVVKARYLTGSPITQWTYVNGFVGDVVTAVVGTPTLDSDNSPTGTASATFAQLRGPINDVGITAASAAAYDPYPTGKVTETYTITVIGSSVNGDFTKGLLRITSASGLDDVPSIVPSARGVATPLGSHGATVTFNRITSGAAGLSESAQDQNVSPDDLLVGQKFSVTVHAVHTATPVPSHNTTYTGTADTSYIVTVTAGNKFATGVAQVTVTTTTGIDISGPTNVAAAGVAIPIGTKGTTITFAGIGLALGDRFYVPVTAKTTGPVRTIVLGNTIDAAVPDGTAVELTLFIKKPALEITQNRTGFAPLTNFDQTDTQITVNSGITAYDETWTDGGVPQPLPVVSDVGQDFGRLYVEYRAWLSELCNEVNGISDVGTIDDQISGPLDPDNPLKWAVFKALENSNGTLVNFTSVCNPDIVSNWADVLELLLGRDDVYGLVPLTKVRTVQDLYAAHVKDQSTAEQGLWRVAWFNLSGIPTIPVVSAGSTVPGHTVATTTNGHVALATIKDDPDATGTQYTIVNVPAANGQFIANGVRPGDIVRALYTGDGFGGSTYSEYVVDLVQSEDSLRLLAGPGAAVNTAAKIEIWRNLTSTEEAAAIAVEAGSFGDLRIRAVWPDTIETAGTIQEGYHLCASLAGLSSGVLPQQGLTNVQIVGYDNVSRTTSKFNKPQLDVMAGSGTWIVTQDLRIGTVYTRHALTTGSYIDLNQREEMIVRNVDAISYRFKDHFKPFIGIMNVTPGTVGLLRLEVLSLIDVLINEKATPLLGGQLSDATIVDLRQHAFLKDRVVLILDITPPAPFNNFEAHLVL